LIETPTSAAQNSASDVIQCRLTSLEIDASNALYVQWLTGTDDGGEFTSDTTADASRRVDCLLRLGVVDDTTNDTLDCSSLQSVADVRAVGRVNINDL
jgi:hypothetical protein